MYRASRIGQPKTAPSIVKKEGSEVWRVTRNSSVCYLKVGSASEAGVVVAEHDRLVWLDGRLSTPPVLAHHVADDTAWLLTAEVPGGQRGEREREEREREKREERERRELRRFHDERAVES